MPSIAAFLSYAIVTTFTPGPNNIMSMTHASRYGLRRSIFFNLGVYAGFFVILTASNFFSAGLFRLLPAIKPFMTFVGAAYILWLAWKIFRSSSHADADSEQKKAKFMSGLLLQFVNAKVLLYGLTISSTFIVPYYTSPFVLLLFSSALATLGFLSTLCWSLFGTVFQRFIRDHEKAVNTVMALLLVYCAVSLFH